MKIEISSNKLDSIKVFIKLTKLNFISTQFKQLFITYLKLS
jgi:hypothetical protein